KPDCPKQEKVWKDTLGKLYPSGTVEPKKSDYDPDPNPATRDWQPGEWFNKNQEYLRQRALEDQKRFEENNAGSNVTTTPSSFMPRASMKKVAGKWKVLLRNSHGGQREQEVSGVDYSSAERAVRKYMKDGEKVVSMTIASKTAAPAPAPAPAAPAQAAPPAAANTPGTEPANPAGTTVVAPPT